MAAWTYAMEAMTSVTAGLIDRGLEDYMLETAMLKVYSTETLWVIVNDSFQIHGGAAYFTDKPLERMLRDHRINQIGEGANEVLTSFIGLVGMREPGEALRTIAQSAKKPFSAVGTIGRFFGHEVSRRFTTPAVPVRSHLLQPSARRLGKLIRRFGLSVQSALVRHREAILERQLVHERIAEAAMEIFASACVLSRRDAELSGDVPTPPAYADAAAHLFLEQSAGRATEALSRLGKNDDSDIIATAESVLRA
jgi:alkylation response protein AidB-like acyl-CoA dehydrogenase